jgi:hypothetical protein
VYRLSLRDAVAFARGGYGPSAGIYNKYSTLMREGDVISTASAG